MYNKITTIFLFSISLWAKDLQDVQIDTVDVDSYQKTDTTKTDKKDNWRGRFHNKPANLIFDGHSPSTTHITTIWNGNN